MKRMLMAFMILHYVGYFLSIVLFFLIIIFLSPAYLTHLDCHWMTLYNLPLLRFLQILLIVLLVLFVSLLDRLSIKSTIYLLKRLSSLFHGNPQHDSIISSISMEHFYNDPQHIILFHYPVWLYKAILNNKIITNEQELDLIKQPVAQKAKFSKRFQFLFNLITHSLFIVLYLLWDIFLEIPLEVRLMLSLPIIITFFILVLFFVDYPYQTLIKLAKKYNITDWN